MTKIAFAIFVKDGSEAYVTNSKFTNCYRGAVTIVSHSKLFLDGGIKVVGCENTAVLAMNNCFKIQMEMQLLVITQVALLLIVPSLIQCIQLLLHYD